MLSAGSGIELNQVLTRLAARRPIFHSEADFQFALAGQIQQTNLTVDVRLESRPRPGIRLDLELRSLLGTTALELKYLTRPWSGVVDGEPYNLRSRALDKRRYDVVKDVARIEEYVAARPGSNGAVVVLASDPALWAAPPAGRAPSIDVEFRIHEGTVLEGLHSWAPTAGHGSTRGREAALQLVGSYGLSWRPYSTDPIELRVLVIEIPA